MPRTAKPHDTITVGDAIGVLLSNRLDRAWVDHADYARIVAVCGNRAWRWIEDSGQVRITVSKTESHDVARLLLRAGRKGLVNYRDEDRLNLRRDNICIVPRTRAGERTHGRKRHTGRTSAPGVAMVLQPPPPRSFPKPPPTFTLPPRKPLPVVATVKRVQRP